MKIDSKKTKNIILKSCFLLLFLVIISLPLFLNAADYKLLEPIPGGVESVTSDGDKIGTYIKTIYNYLMGLAIALSVLMLVIGGVEYTTSFASESQAGNAKKRITDAITGLLIALLSYVILNTVSPNLVMMDLPDAGSCSASMPSGSSTGPTPSSGSSHTLSQSPTVGGQSSTPFGDEQTVRAELSSINISVNNLPCQPGQTTGCTNLNNLGTSAVVGLKELRTSCPDCDLVVTGGTEGGHLTHRERGNQVDLRKRTTLNDYVISTSGGNVSSTSRGPLYTLPNGDKYLDEGDHWHVVYTNDNR